VVIVFGIVTSRDGDEVVGILLEHLGILLEHLIACQGASAPIIEDLERVHRARCTSSAITLNETDLSQQLASLRAVGSVTHHPVTVFISLDRRWLDCVRLR
jgi:hypothetical protein